MLLFYSRGQPGAVFDHMNYYVTFISQAQIEAVFGLDSQKKKKSCSYQFLSDKNKFSSIYGFSSFDGY